MSGWTIAFYTFLLARPLFGPSPQATPATENRTVAWLKIAGMLTISVIALIVFSYATTFTASLAVWSLVGTAFVIASALIISDRWGKWGQLLFNFTFGGVGLLIYEFVPKTGSDAIGLFFCFAIIGINLIEAIRLLQQQAI